MKKTKHNKFVCFVLKNVQNRQIYAIILIHKQQFFFIIFDETFVFEIQKIKFKSSKKHHIWAKIESEISSLNQKSNFRSLIFESFFSFENQFEHIFIDFCQFISFFNIFDEININFSKQWSNQKFSHYIRNFRSNFYFFDRIRIIYLFRKFFKIIFVFLTNWSFFYSFDQFDISFKNFQIYSQYFFK